MSLKGSFAASERTKGLNRLLILTRKIGETICIGKDVTLTVLGVKGNQIRVGINAPKTLSVHRKEIWLKIQNEKAESKKIEEEAISEFS